MVIRRAVCVWRVLILIPFFTSGFFLPAKKQSRPAPPTTPWISQAIKTRSIPLIPLVCRCRICHLELLLAAVWILKFDFNYRQGRDQSRLLIWPLSRLLSFVSVCLCFQAFVSRANMYQKQPSRKAQTMAEELFSMPALPATTFFWLPTGEATGSVSGERLMLWPPTTPTGLQRDEDAGD